ncbi:hypothetical protein L596_018407 [Steinernema carpocapsae]|uniref:Uncharacterized protein n=1 Tax=Steinernema carpocapsae TaxID=34508 RepID=A0A4U5N597_STECR|nr:hypothetical protein L596_018407 [Steinernema carpocapsae]
MVKEHSDFAWRTSVRKKKSINDGMETSNSKTDPWDCLVMDRNSHIVQAAILKQDVDGYIIERRKKQKGGSTRGMESYDVSEVRVERGSLLEPTPSNNASIRAELDMAYLMSDAKPSNRRKYFRCIDITANVFLGVDDFECVRDELVLPGFY